MKFSLVPGTEHIPPGGEEWLVFGGLGQLDSRNAAREFYDAQGKNQAVSSVRYATGGINADTMATGLSQYIKERNIKRLSVVGVSMGLPTFLVGWSELQRRAAASSSQEQFALPRIERMAAYSSPFDMEDAWNGELAHIVAASGYKGGLLGKFAYSLVDGPGDVRRLLASRNLEQLRGHIARSWSQTTDGGPPEFFVSQLALLVNAHLATQWKVIKHTFMPGAHFVYCLPSDLDTVVRDDSAVHKYASSLRTLDIDNRTIVVPHGGHANTLLSARALMPWLTDTARGVLK
jgi:hypothetical protein